LKLCFILAIASLFLGCAQPDYLDSNTKLSDNSEKPGAQCLYKLPKQQSCVSIKWNNSPSSKDNNSFDLELSETVDDRLFIILWMPSMGHGSAPVNALQRDPRNISVSHVYFIMPGYWEIQISTRNSQGEVTDKLNIPVNIP